MLFVYLSCPTTTRFLAISLLYFCTKNKEYTKWMYNVNFIMGKRETPLMGKYKLSTWRENAGKREVHVARKREVHVT